MLICHMIHSVLITFSHIVINNSHMKHNFFLKINTFGVFHSAGLVNIFGVVISVSILVIICSHSI